jgi:sugar fermentation stimulation protein A
MLVYSFPPLSAGKLVKRYKRFFADIELENGEIITAHCANTGPMTGICDPGSKVYISHSNDPKRKLKYSWQLIEVDQTLVGINTSLPNKVVGAMLEQRLLPELEPYASYKGEVKYGNEKSRIDFLLTDPTVQTYVEIKNTTWAKGDLALFPDTVTTRGQKHLRELMAVIDPKAAAASDLPLLESAITTKATLIYFINRHDCDRFAPGDEADPEYGRLFREAIEMGVMVLPCRFQISPQGIEYLGLAEIVI